MAHRNWEAWEDEYLKDNYGKLGRQEIARKLNRTLPAVANRAKYLKIAKRKEPPWTDQEIKQMKRLWYTHSIKSIAKKMGRTQDAIKVKSTRLKLGPQLDPKKWTAREISEILKIDVHVVLRWIDKKLIEVSKAPGTGAYQVTTKELERFLLDNPDNWDSRKCPDLHLELKSKELCGPKHWKVWGKSKEVREIPENLRESFWEFVIKTAEDGIERIKKGKERPVWLQDKLKQDQLIAENRFKKWTPEEDEILKKLFKKQDCLTYKEIGEKLGRSSESAGRRLSRISVWD